MHKVPTVPGKRGHYFHLWPAEKAAEAAEYHGYGAVGDSPPHMSLMLVWRGGKGIFSKKRNLKGVRDVEIPQEEAEFELRVVFLRGSG